MVGQEPWEESRNWTLYPNPSSGDFSLQLDLDQASNIQMKIMDVTGKLIEHRTVQASPGKSIETFSLNVPAGTYIILVTDGEREWRKSLVIAE